MTPLSGMSVVPLLAASAALGFYVAIFIVAAVLGDAAFNAAFPNPWRMLLMIPSVVTPVTFLLVEKGRRRV